MENESLGEGSECVLGYLPLDILPARLLCLFTRWSGTAQLQVVCRGWRSTTACVTTVTSCVFPELFWRLYVPARETARSGV